MVREVERHRHVGLPHTALHVVHGKGMLGVLVERHRFFVLIVGALIVGALIVERPGCGVIVIFITLVKDYIL